MWYNELQGMILLAIDSDSDSLASFCSSYRMTRLYPQLAQTGAQIIQRSGPESVRTKIVPATASAQYITGSGHGFADTFTGHAFDPIFHVGSYSENEVNNKIVHFLACDAGRLLGPDLVQKGCKAFLGYKEKFILDLESMIAAQLSIDCDAEIDRSLTSGLTAEEAYQRSINMFQAAQFAVASNPRSVAIVQWNMQSLVGPTVDPIFGDPSARI